MKKLLLAVGLMPFASFGQIVLNNTHFPVANDQLIMSTATDPTIDYLSTGANYAWDFASLTATGQRFSDYRPMSQASQLSFLLFGSFAATPYKASYFSPTTDLPLDQLTASFPISIDEISLFSKSTTSALTMVGYEFIFSGQGIPVKSDTIETRYPFPLNYGDAYTSRGYTNLDMNPLYDAKWIQHRYRESAVDGWGSITTPYGTFNALRIHHKILETDSLYVSFDTLGTWIGIPVPESHEYEWRAMEEKEAILRIRTSVVLGNEVVTAIEFRDELNGLGIEEQELALSVYPNPTSDELFIQSTGNIQRIDILNQQGQLVKTIIGNNHFNETTNVADLDAGMYQLVVHSEKGSRIQLFVKN